MKTFNACRFPSIWYGQSVAAAAESLEFALYRLRRSRAEGIWKFAHRQTVRSCVRDLRYELAIRKSRQAQHLRGFFPHKGMS